MKTVKKLVADFETTTASMWHDKSKSIKLDNIKLWKEYNHTRVWATGIYDIELKEMVHISNNINEFMNVIRLNSRKYSLEIYFHNLKFDGEFCLSYLYNNNFKYDDELSTSNTFRTLITDTGLFYQLEIRFYDKKAKGKIVTIRDSLKIIPLKVSQMAKAFGLKTLKGDIDYQMYRTENHKLTKIETDYLINDCKIVGDSLSAMFDLGLTKMTIASNSLEFYKETLGGKSKFRGLFPLLTMKHITNSPIEGMETVDDFIRKSYKGGYTYVNPKIAHQDLFTPGKTYDVNSLYPSRMYYEFLPHSMPIYFNGEYKENNTHPLYIQRLKCKFKLNKGYIPIIQLNNARFKDNEYITSSGVERVELFVTNIDLELIKKHYTLTNITYIEGYMFKASLNLFQKYIDYWIDVKNKATIDGNKGLRQIAKLMLNSLYGKFATNGVSDVKIPYLSHDGVVKQISKCNIDQVDFTGSLEDEEDREINYTAMACFITAYARKVTIEAIQDVGGLKKNTRFCYCDTDSIHILGLEEPKIWIDDVELGAWKHESDWTYGKFIRAKTYLEEIDGHLDVKCAGMPENVKELVTKKNFKVGFKVLADDKSIDNKYKKLMPRRVKGGIILKETDFTIK